MITLAAPLGLLALFALAVPLLVHLWRPPPRVVRLGSLRFLREGARHPVRNLRWRELLLLALRCALLGTIALLLAQPLWNRSAAPAAKWALRSPDAVLAGEAARAWETLRAEGYEIRWLAPGFPVDRPAAGSVDLWSLLAEADARLPAGAALAVAAPGLLRSLQGPRPELSREVRWIPSGVRPLPPTAPLPVEPLKVSVQADPNRAEDARRVRAAGRALGWKLDQAAAPDWIIALGAVELPESAKMNVLRDAESAAPSVAVQSQFAAARLWQRVPGVVGEGAVVLERDSAGDPILTERRVGSSRELRVCTRFHPDWMDAAASTALPLWLQRVLSPAPADSAADLRTVAASQARPALASPEAPRASLPEPKPVELTNVLWLVALGLFAAERLWNLRR